MALTLKRSIVLLVVSNDVPRATIWSLAESQTPESSDLLQGCQCGDPCCGRRKVFYGAKDPDVRAGATSPAAENAEAFWRSNYDKAAVRKCDAQLIGTSTQIKLDRARADPASRF